MPLPFSITKPNERSFAAIIGVITMVLAGLALRDCFLVADDIGLTLWQSKTLLAVALLRSLLLAAGLALFSLAYFRPANLTRLGQWVSAQLGRLEKFTPILRTLSILALPSLLAIYLIIFLKTDIGGLFANYGASRFLLFWLFSLVGSLWILLGWHRTWFEAWLISLMLLSAGYRLLLFLPEISTNPFSLGWSEGSRIYLPALFNSTGIFGKSMPLPILHPTLHMLLYPPYAVDAPILLHRIWRVGLLLVLSGLTSYTLLRRQKIPSGWGRFLLFVWATLALLTLPVYLHLLPPVILLVWLVSAKHPGRTLAALVVASVWAGLSRINWYPVPAMLTIALLLLERKQQPLKTKDWFALAGMFVGGTVLAAVSMQAYIRFSGIPQSGDFFTSLSSSLLWDRLLPSQTYALGVLPAILLYAYPFVMALVWVCWPRKDQPAALAMQANLILALQLIALFVGGLLVSAKIGGGSDIHNLDAFALLLILITLFLIFSHKPTQLPWVIALSLVLVPAGFSASSLPSFSPSNPPAWQSSLQSIQDVVDANNAAGKPTLFISQRQLLSLGLIQNVELDPLYDREDLMEMAMSGNQTYLGLFTQKLEQHQFGAIIVDPLTFTYKGTTDAMGAEHNAWTKSVIRPILCNYQPSLTLPEAKITIYVPLIGEQNCPSLPKKGE